MGERLDMGQMFLYLRGLIEGGQHSLVTRVGIRRIVKSTSEAIRFLRRKTTATININNKIPLILILRKIQEVTPISKMYTEVVVDNLHKLHYR